MKLFIFKLVVEHVFLSEIVLIGEKISIKLSLAGELSLPDSVNNYQ